MPKGQRLIHLPSVKCAVWKKYLKNERDLLKPLFKRKGTAPADRENLHRLHSMLVWREIQYDRYKQGFAAPTVLAIKDCGIFRVIKLNYYSKTHSDIETP